MVPRKSGKRPPGASTLEKNARERLLEAGLDEFGRHGFEAATTRGIARRAGVNIALIPYYFEGKEGLYRAVVEHMIGHIRSHLEATLQEIDAPRAGEPPAPQESAALLMRLLGNLIDFMVGSAQAPRFARIILREQLFPTSAYDSIFNHMMRPVIQAIAHMLSLAVGLPLTSAVQLRAISMVGQILAFRVARETVVRMLGMEGYSSAETEQIRHIILEQTKAAIDGLGAMKKEKT